MIEKIEICFWKGRKHYGTRASQSGTYIPEEACQ